VSKQIVDLDDETPPNEIEGLETTSEVQLLYGRNETYLKQHDVWMYALRDGDKPKAYGLWTLKFHDDIFVEPAASTNFSEWKDDATSSEEINIEEACTIVPGKTLPVTVVVFRSVVDVDWEVARIRIRFCIEITR